MEFVRKLIGQARDQALSWLPGCEPPAGAVATAETVLRHAPSGLLLTDGSSLAHAVRFPSPSAASAFRRRYLDEPDGWEPVAAAAPELEAALRPRYAA